MLVHWIWLATRPGLNDFVKAEVLRQFRDPEDVYYADPESYKQVGGITQEGVSSLQNKNLDEAQQILETCENKGISILTYRDALYPNRLKNIADPPVLLYYKGKMPEFDALPVIAVVGTRKASPYGLKTAKNMGTQIARCGGLLLSGLATGIDAMSMRGALSAGKSVVGLMGCGVDVVYPAYNRSLLLDTQRYGCLISEYPPGTPPYKWNFPRRNRIISGLSSGVLVVEAPEKSGSLITARLAGEQGRDVFVVPGNVDLPTFAGSYRLLREGATPVNSGWDILCEYEGLYPDKLRRDMTSLPRERTEEKAAQPQIKPQKTVKKQPEGEKTRKITIDKASPTPYIDLNETLPKLTQEERALVSALRAGPRQADDVIAETGLTTGKFLAAMTMLEIKGIVKRLPGKRIQLK